MSFFVSSNMVVQCDRGRKFKKSSEIDVVMADIECSNHRLMFLLVSNTLIACDR